MNRKQDLALACLLALVLHGAVFFLLGLLPPAVRTLVEDGLPGAAREVEILLPEEQKASADFIERSEASEPRSVRLAPDMPGMEPAPSISDPPVFSASPKVAAIRVSAGDDALPGESLPSAVGTASATVGPATGTDRPAGLDRITRPKYPFAARRRGEEGRVRMTVRVSASGKVQAVWVVQGSGSDELDEVAAAAVRQAAFHPARRNGQVVDSDCEVTFEFRLEDAGGR